MPDSGSGTMTPSSVPVIIGLTNLPSLTALETLCLSFDTSLARLHINNRCGAYGAPVENCNVAYKVYQRESWLQALLDAQTMVERAIGRPICPSEICDEVHPCASDIELLHRPIAYLGSKSWSDLVEAELTLDVETGKWYTDVCDVLLPEDFSPEYIQFIYPDEVMSCYRGLQALQVPCATRIESGCDGGGGYRFTWDKCQLIRPDVDEANPTSTNAAEIAKFITAVRWRTYTIDTTNAVQWVGECNCDCCSTPSTPALTLSITDAREGRVCINRSCNCQRGRRVKIAYATSMDCYGRNDDLLRAVVLLALNIVGHTGAKPCGCDNRFVDHMLEMDPTATTEFASKIKFGPSFGQMEAMRIVNGYLQRPVLHSPIETGGLLTAGRRSRTRRLA